jgi:hypothetical protein
MFLRGVTAHPSGKGTKNCPEDWIASNGRSSGRAADARSPVTKRLTRKEQFDRSKINMHDLRQVRCWTHALGVSREQLRKAVEKVGDSAVTVRKELGIPEE